MAIGNSVHGSGIETDGVLQALDRSGRDAASAIWLSGWEYASLESFTIQVEVTFHP